MAKKSIADIRQDDDKLVNFTPSFALLTRRDGRFCNAVAISPDTIMTIGHCVGIVMKKDGTMATSNETGDEIKIGNGFQSKKLNIKEITRSSKPPQPLESQSLFKE